MVGPAVILFIGAALQTHPTHSSFMAFHGQQADIILETLVPPQTAIDYAAILLRQYFALGGTSYGMAENLTVEDLHLEEKDLYYFPFAAAVLKIVRESSHSGEDLISAKLAQLNIMQKMILKKALLERDEVRNEGAIEGAGRLFDLCAIFIMTAREKGEEYIVSAATLTRSIMDKSVRMTDQEIGIKLAKTAVNLLEFAIIQGLFMKNRPLNPDVVPLLVVLNDDRENPVTEASAAQLLETSETLRSEALRFDFAQTHTEMISLVVDNLEVQEN